MSVRLTNEHRRAQILSHAEALAKEHGLYAKNFNVALVAHSAGVSKPTVHKHFCSMIALRTALIEESFQGDGIIFNMALVCKDPVAKRLGNGTPRVKEL